ncbi:kxDL motif-containing protein 1 isoform X1 [Cinclus cinclus]|uniref:kxDL motif-containing protein 1 isoform X1 n=1 Tax=Cinclus cinclus TaxID=127875 RepID=UPI002E1024C3
MILLWMGWAVLHLDLLGVVTKCGIQKLPMCWEGWGGVFQGFGEGIPQHWDLLVLSTTAGGQGRCRAVQLQIPQLPTDSDCSLLHRTLKGKLAKQYPEAFSNIHESPILEDDDDFDPVPKSTTTTIATSEQSTESCDTSPDVISPTTSQDFEDLSQGQYDSPAMNGQSLTDEDTANGLD